MQLQLDCSTRGNERLETRQPESEPVSVLAQCELNPRFELIQSGGFICTQRASHALICNAAKYTCAEALQPGDHFRVFFSIQCDDRPHASCRTTQQKPAKILQCVRIQVCNCFKIIDQQ